MKQRKFLYVLLLGALVRIVFNLFIAKYYYGSENIYLGGDTPAWMNMFENLWNHGVFVAGDVNNPHEYGYFLRMPGYSFFLGFCWLITGKNWDWAIPLAGWLQTFMDIFNIYLIYQIAFMIFRNSRTAIISALLYALYPFVIVWNPHTHSEIISITFGLLAIYFYMKASNKDLLLSGIMLAIATYMRPQYMFLFPFMGLLILYHQRGNIPQLLTKASIFGMSFVFLFGLWPLRNYVNHGKLILTQDLRGASNWDVDVINFMQYIYSVKSEWEPQMSQILSQSDVEIPAILQNHPEEAARLAAVFNKAQTCSRGFTFWKTSTRARQLDRGCTDDVAQAFNDLRERHKQMFAWNYYVVLPLKNFKKALFKSQLYDSDTAAKKLISLLFYYRTFMILLGIAAILMMLKQGLSVDYAFLFGMFFISLYIFLCAGTSPQMRNIEMRYFLQADLLLLIPCAWLINQVLNKWRSPELSKA